MSHQWRSGSSVDAAVASSAYQLWVAPLLRHSSMRGIVAIAYMAMQSLKSRGYVNETYNWRHYYWYLNNEGINYLREYLHLPVEIVPTTLRRAARPEGQRPRPKGFGGAPSGRPEDDRSTYRRADGFGGAEGKPAGAGSDFRPEFRGGFGRGAPRGGGRGGFGGAQ
ncbi:small ribosomal subunit protein eS10-like isoform X2 [Sycon ciliatum]|uniref:small ribosomal subunit protein eS10-like isoform X2 n=1 Tax=Sycon ciliatum TaxID=27933 RepID=UPI0031F670E8